MKALKLYNNLLWNWKVHLRVQKNPVLIAILSQPNQITPSNEFLTEELILAQLVKTFTAVQPAKAHWHMLAARRVSERDVSLRFYELKFSHLHSKLHTIHNHHLKCTYRILRTASSCLLILYKRF
jgi:hypothetical protein